METGQARTRVPDHASESNTTLRSTMPTRNGPLLTERLNRRRLLKVAGGLLLMSVVDLHFDGRAAVAATRMSWQESGVFPRTGLYQSPVFQADQAFNSVEIVWQGDLPNGASADFAVRVSSDGNSWTDWIETHLDSHVRSLSDTRNFQVPALVSSSRYVQYRVNLIAAPAGAPPSLERVELACVDTSGPAQYLDAPKLIDGFIIPRAGWGADESLRYDANGKEIWPPEYRPVQKVIIHHTVTQNHEQDPAATVRAIYYYHAITQGWGDIGYNFLVDWHGNVYEGRIGGPNVVAGHALQYNWGSIGIALLGDFSKTDVDQPALDSLVRVIKDRAANVDPAGIGFFIDKDNVPNICGHRDVLSTECPGDRAYIKIPYIRGWCKGIDQPIFVEPIAPGKAKAAVTGLTFAPVPVYSGSELRVDITVKNTGSATLGTQGPASGYTYVEGQDFNSAGYPKLEGLYRVGIDFAGNQGVANPYRWGLPGPLEPGDTATITGYIRLRTPGDWTLSASVMQEWIKYDQQGAFPQKVKVLPPPTAPAAQQNDPSLVYESVTGHNVPTVFHDYWTNNGGLFRFGYPLTEPFQEVSETDGGTYLTQYFERARFEHHPENAGTQYEVLLGLLGRERTAGRENEAPFQPVADPGPTDEYDFYPETGHLLGHGYRDYWTANGGLTSFGYPISEPFEEMSQTDGVKHTVQYFERVRIEYHPENAGTPYNFLLGQLAREMLIDRGWLTADS